MKQQAWVVAVDMGYGHQRAAYPLRHWSPTGSVLIANDYPGIPERDLRLWRSGRRTYEFFSRLSQLPVAGGFFFGLLDKFQEVPPFYPRRDLSAPNIQVKQNYYLVRHGLGRRLIEYLNQEEIPLITTFFTVAFMAEEHKFKSDIYLAICDADISRAWAPLHPRRSRIRYLAPCRRVVDRLKLYGVREENIFLTGFPLPEENIGPWEGRKKLATLRRDLAARIVNLDPQQHYREKYGSTVRQFLKGAEPAAQRPLTLTFAVGGAGAQREIGRQILVSLKRELMREELAVNLVAGTRHDVYRYFRDAVGEIGIRKTAGNNLNIIFSTDKQEYFGLFNTALRTTDILWTKPSELVFYSALGIPIVMAPTLGSQEKFNRTWLKTIGAGIAENDPRYTREWLLDWVRSGFLAEAAMSGYLDGRQFGVHNIADVVFRGAREPAKDYQLL